MRNFRHRLEKLEAEAANLLHQLDTGEFKIPGAMGFASPEEHLLVVMELLLKSRGRDGQRITGELKEKMEAEIASLRLRIHGNAETSTSPRNRTER